MAHFDVRNPTYNSQLEKLSTSNPAHADLFNALFQQLLENDEVLRTKKVDEATGKGLSSNDFTNELKEKLDGISPGTNIPLILGTQTAITAAWTGKTTEFKELVDGMVINYYLPYASTSNVTLNLTLSDGTTTGDIACYYRNDTRLSAHMPQYSLFPFIYRENGLGNVTTPGWWLYTTHYTDTDTFNKLQYNNAITVVGTLYRYKFIGQGTDGKWYPLFTTDKTSLSVVEGTWGVSTAGFRIDTPILYYYTSPTVEANGIVADFYRTASLDVRYNFNVSTITAYEPVLLKGTINSAGGFVIDSTDYLSQSFPTTDDGYYYMWLGYAYSTTSMRLDIDHSIYYFKNGKLNIYIGIADNARFVAIQPTAPDDTSMLWVW